MLLGNVSNNYGGFIGHFNMTLRSDGHYCANIDDSVAVFSDTNK